MSSSKKFRAALTKQVSQNLNIPTIGIGAGPDADGQILVLHDLLGITKEFKPRFLRRYADLNGIMNEAIANYVDDVKTRSFPNESEAY